MGTDEKPRRRTRRKRGGRRRRGASGAATDVSAVAEAGDEPDVAADDAAAGREESADDAGGARGGGAAGRKKSDPGATKRRPSRRAKKAAGDGASGAETNGTAPSGRRRGGRAADEASDEQSAGAEQSADGSDETADDGDASTATRSRRGRRKKKQRGGRGRKTAARGAAETDLVETESSHEDGAESDDEGAEQAPARTAAAAASDPTDGLSAEAGSAAVGEGEDGAAEESAAAKSTAGRAKSKSRRSTRKKTKSKTAKRGSTRRRGEAAEADADAEAEADDDSATAVERKKPASNRMMLINTKEPEEIRVAIIDDGELDDLLFESTSQNTYLNNIYLGRIVNIEPSIGAAFVDFGGERNGFLHESDIVHGALDGDASATKKPVKGERRSIQSLVRKGQQVVVQITKDGIGSKGPTLTTNISIPGRYLVLMPYLGRYGVSRKIPDKEERKRLKSLLGDLEPPSNLGVIIRTAGVDRAKAELQKDLRYLLNLWEVISKRIEGAKAPATIYLESDLIIRTIRDYFTGDISRILVDSESVARKCRDFLKAVMPRYQNRVEHYAGRQPLFHEYNVEEQIERIYNRKIDLPGGGSVVIEPTEALVAVDVNSGKYRDNEDPEDTAYQTDLKAIPVIVRQIRLRDLGGLLIIDFIDMQDEKHRRSIEREMRAALKRDRARAKMTRMSEFGIIEITRQRVRRGLGLTNFHTCPQCRGSGQVKTVDSQVLAVLRQIRASLARERSRSIVVALHPEVAEHLQNSKRRQILGLEEEFNKSVSVVADPTLLIEDLKVSRVRQTRARNALHPPPREVH